MQKLMSRNPFGFQASLSLSSLPLSFSFDFLCLGFYKNPQIPFFPSFLKPSIAMPSLAALQSLRHSSLPNSTARFPFSTGERLVTKTLSSQSMSCQICRCYLPGVAPMRAWAYLERKNWSGSQAKLFSTVAVATDKGLLAPEGGTEGLESSKPDAAAGEWSPKDFKEQEGERSQRRQRSGSPIAGPLQGNPDLLAIPGVGPRNLKKLVEKGFEDVSQLKKLYRDKFFGTSSEKMVEFLQSSVGIIHKNHAESITTFIKKSVDEELKDRVDSDIKTAQKKRITFCVEGNISVGKTTFLQRIANETLELQDLVEVVPEPIGKWQDIGPDHFNILDAFYAEPQRYAYTFQNYVFVTRVMQERESSSGIKPLRLMERSVFSDRMVFVRAVHEANWMNEMEISIYDSWFDPVVSTLPGLIPDGFIYLRASPDTCHKRMMLRKRDEEGGVSLDYLRDLHEKHESWLFPFESGNHGILSVSKLPQTFENNLPLDIRDRVFYLEGNHMHPSIEKVPALVLDCEPNIDFNRDIEAKRQYAQQVAEFFEFVKKKKEVNASGFGEKDSPKINQPQLLLPQRKGMWVPEGKFSDFGLKSLDLRRTMSLLSH
ncbi:hypothetical protein DM860_002711 [Cuscuta australis]|uniref:Deoxynucleoside kinase domain-containing protein n=1 Tax=Cuscuta australis TaxID=267555 RepID=A0A328D486_9ASTE|nr:hypothetical protein DM860_002711 [Cuscuta australis]